MRPMGDILHHPERATAITAGGEGAGSQMAPGPQAGIGRGSPAPGREEGGYGNVWDGTGG